MKTFFKSMFYTSLTLLALLLVVIVYKGSDDSPTDAYQKEKDRIAGFHCLSSWDGSHRQLERDIKNRLKDPDSYEHIETSITPVNTQGTHTLYTSFRARNGFGGMTITNVVATVNNSDCTATIISME